MQVMSKSYTWSGLFGSRQQMKGKIIYVHITSKVYKYSGLFDLCGLFGLAVNEMTLNNLYACYV